MSTSTTLPDCLRDAGPADAWPAVLATDEVLWKRVEGRLEALPEAVSHAIRDRLASGDRSGPAWARVALWALGICGVDGALAEEVLPSGIIRMRSPRGAFLLTPLAFGLDHLGPGRPEDVKRLVDALAGLPFESRYTLHIKQSLPAGLDVEPVAQAVGLWLMALRNGEAGGRCASYIDGKVALELCLSGPVRRGSEPALLTLVTPKRSLDALAEMDARIMHAVQEADALGEEIPLLVTLGGNRSWPVTRGFAHQVLYGTAREVVATIDADAPRYEALYLANGLSLFSDPLCRMLSGIWWLEPDDAWLDVRGWASDNPWSDPAPAVPRIEGRTFARREGPAGPNRACVMAWTSDSYARWSAP